MAFVKQTSPVRIAGFLALSAFASLGFGALANAVSARVENACANDYSRFCPSYAVGSSQLRQCMRAAGRKLSPRCIDALQDSGEISRKGRRN